MPGGTLVEGIVFGLCAGRVPFLIEPIEVRIVIGDPLCNGLPGRFDGLDGLDGIDVEGRRWRAGKLDDAFPKALEAEEELDFFAAEESANWFHGPRAAG
ncbi:MAG: hypothetical protein P8P32_16980, partial [Akkermansiaceae bacterium]|nr:hypothetical protein [Akkermansiaceae bacterium]